MPFDDGKDLELKCSLENLSHVLRHKELWPEGFKWDYRHCETCAMGLASRLWREVEYSDSHEMASVFGLPTRTAVNIFVYLGEAQTMQDITPEHVADAINAYLKI